MRFMNILYLNYLPPIFSTDHVILFKDHILSSLNAREKKILLIASLVFSLLATCYIIHRICFKAKPLLDNEKDEKEEKSIEQDPHSHLTSQLLEDYDKESLSLSLENKLAMAAQSGKYLTALNLQYTRVTNEQLQEVIRACPILKKLNLSGCNKLTDAGLKDLPKDLHTLNLSRCNQLPDAGLKGLPKGLHTLNLSWCNQLTDAGLKGLPKGLHT